MNKRWTNAEIDKLKELYPFALSKDLSKLFGRSQKAINSKAKNLKIKKDPEFWRPVIFTDSEIQYIKENYANTRTDLIAIKLNKEIELIYRKAAQLCIKKSKEFLASPDSGIFIKGSTTGHEYRYPKGHIPANKGEKMSPELYKKCEPTMFKKGRLPHNTKSDGEISIRKSNNGSLYYHIRLSLGKWQALHRFLWEKENGKIPNGFNIIFKDGNNSNCKIENLELISNTELMQRNSIHNYPEDLQKLIQVKGALQRQINKILENE